MSVVVVLPYVWQPYFDDCIATVKIPREQMLIIDNTRYNHGIMRSHNMGIDFMREKGADWLVIMSAAIRFGPSGGLDYLDVLEKNTDNYYALGAASENVGPIGGGHPVEDPVNKVFGWHLLGFHRRVFDAIGRWDANFSPYGLDDLDMSLRIKKHFHDPTGWETAPCDVFDTTMSHSISLAGVVAPYAPREEYFVRKWGRKGGDWQNDGYEHPFNDPENPLSYWPRAMNGDSCDGGYGV